MTFTYCDARHDGTPVHRCLCSHQVMHNGAHKCVCGHTWGIDWNQLTYDQQRELLGLPQVRIKMLLDWVRASENKPYVWSDCPVVTIATETHAGERP